jgi:hypothetical protein
MVHAKRVLDALERLAIAQGEAREDRTGAALNHSVRTMHCILATLLYEQQDPEASLA